MEKLSYEKLTDIQIAAQLATVTGWEIEDGTLTRLYQFGAYMEGVTFAVSVAEAAEKLNHHPDIVIGYQKVRILLVTHDAGGGLTSFDFELARRINSFS